MTVLSAIDTTHVQPRLFTVPVLYVVTSGGLPLGGTTLIGGAPGTGKSTLLLEAACAVPWESFYFTGEEPVEAIAQRAARLGLRSDVLRVVATHSAYEVATTVSTIRPALCVVDSIQSITAEGSRGAPGPPSHLRAVVGSIGAAARASGTAVIFVCHETKDGGFAGPRTVEHDVDIVLRMTREPRRITVVKNRFGPAPLELPIEVTQRGVRIVR
jgi:DNA repair protein RadA/Sms